jgi:hypothetical protein
LGETWARVTWENDLLLIIDFQWTLLDSKQNSILMFDWFKLVVELNWILSQNWFQTGCKGMVDD